MKNSILTFGIIILLFQPVFAADSDSVSRKEFLQVIKELKQQNEKLAAENLEIKKQNSQISQQNRQLIGEVSTIKARSLSNEAELSERLKIFEKGRAEESAIDKSDIAYLQEDIEEMSEIINNVERKINLDRINFGGELRTRADWFDYKDDNSNHEEEVHCLISTRFRLNLMAEISKRLQFRCRLTMYENWNDYDFDAGADQNYARIPTNTDLKVERCYVDYLFSLHPKLPMAFTFGRQPLADGMPTNFRENTTRKSNYPSLAFETEGDALVLSFKLNKLTGLRDSGIKLLWTWAVCDNDDELYRKNPLNIEELSIYIAQFETRLPGKYFEDMFLILNSLYMPDMPSIDMTGGSSGDGLVPIKLPNSLGSSISFTFYLQAERYMQSNFDWFLCCSYVDRDASEQGMIYQVAPFVRIPMGLGSSDNKDDRNGIAYYLGFRYNIPWAFLNGAKFGLEFNHGSKHWGGGGLAAPEDPLNKLKLNGHAWDTYYIQPITKHFSTRIGYTWLKRSYKRGLSKPRRTDEKITNFYLLLDARF